jgi:hypothetical protein
MSAQTKTTDGKAEDARAAESSETATTAAPEIIRAEPTEPLSPQQLRQAARDQAVSLPVRKGRPSGTR